MLNRRVLIKDDRVVILDACILLVGHFYLPVCESIHLVILQVHLIHIRLLVEESGLDLGASHVDQLYVEKTSATPLIFPAFL